MKVLLVLLIFLLNGCYLANGSPSSSEYWLKSGKKISYAELSTCNERVYMSFGNRYFYLREKLRMQIPNENNKDEYNEYLDYLHRSQPLISKCYFDLGYRFTAPYYWCLAQDNGGKNMEICKINQKYR